MPYNDLGGYNSLISGSGNSTLINFQVKKPVFLIGIDNTQQGQQAYINMSLNKPVFSLAISNENQSSLSVDFSIKKPVFSVGIQNGEIIVEFNESTNYTQKSLSTNYTQG